MSDADKRKIIVDEDWKTQVEREREELKKKPPESSAAGPDEGPDEGEIPPASFPMLVTSIGTQAMMALGQVPDPATGKPIFHPDLARHHIDTLAVLQEKTKGNLSREEEQMLDEFVHQLRQVYVMHTTSPPAPGPGGGNMG